MHSPVVFFLISLDFNQLYNLYERLLSYSFSLLLWQSFYVFKSENGPHHIHTKMTGWQAETALQHISCNLYGLWIIFNLFPCLKCCYGKETTGLPFVLIEKITKAVTHIIGLALPGAQAKCFYVYINNLWNTLTDAKF